MTIHVHRSNRAVGYGDHWHEAPAKNDDGSDNIDRTWSFECTKVGCEERILRDVEHTGRTVASVPLTVEEKDEQEAIEQMGKKDVTQMAMAMTQWAKGQAKEQAATSSSAA
jgi:hypothetical protein